MYPLDKDFLPKMFNSFVCSFFKHYMEDVAFTTPPHTAHLKCLRCQLRDLQPPQPHYGSALKHPSASAEGLDSIPGLGRSPERGNGKPLQYSCLENSMNRGAWPAAIHVVTKTRTRLSDRAHMKIIMHTSVS